jgi:hypothetical protein
MIVILAFRCAENVIAREARKPLTERASEPELLGVSKAHGFDTPGLSL